MIKVKAGDFITASQKGLPKEEGIRQGIFIDKNTMFCESVGKIEISRIHAIVPDENLWGSTKEFVVNWRKDNLP